MLDSMACFANSSLNGISRVEEIGHPLRIITALFIFWPVFCSAQPSAKNEQHQDEMIAKVRAMPGVEERGHADVIEFFNRAQGAVILITRPGHPAHPAVVKHQSIERHGQLIVETTSSSAGDPIALKKWIDHMSREQQAAFDRKGGAKPVTPDDVD